MILVGEMRDLETIATALTAAETGHLVFATLHTTVGPPRPSTASSTSSRRSSSSKSGPSSRWPLQGIVTQQLLPTTDGQGRVVACEVLVPNPAVRNLIREAKTHQIYSAIPDRRLDRHADHGRRLGPTCPRRPDHPRARRGRRASVPEELRRLLGTTGYGGGAAFGQNGNGDGSGYQQGNGGYQGGTQMPSGMGA